MYIRCRRYSRTKQTVSICESKREGKKVIQRVVKYLGIAQDESHLKAMKALAKSEIARIIKKKTKERAKETLASQHAVEILRPPIENLVEEQRLIEGFHDIFSPMFKELGLETLFSPTRLNQLGDLVIARIAEPCSKLRTAEFLKRDYDRHLSEDQIYKLMDIVATQEDAIQLKVFESTKERCPNETVDVLFFDVTTLYFESQQNDLLRAFGYSKDHKIGEEQVVLALATTSKGFPIGYTLFPGNTAEVKTLLSCLEDWRKRLLIENVIIVADRAMMSGKNLQEMEKAKFKYVIASKLKALPVMLKNKILDRHKEQESSLDGEKFLIQEHTYQDRRLIVSFSESRAKKDKSDRDRLVKKIKEKFKKASKSKTRNFVTNKGYLKYTAEQAEGELVFEEKKIDEEEKWDGLHGIITNDTEAKAIDLLQRYRGLWVIEESFRINKHSLAMRPIYHFKPERVRAHILICYLAFALTRYVQEKVQVLNEKMSIEKIRDVLSTIEASILRDQETGNRYKLSSKMNREATIIYRAVGVDRSYRTLKM